MYLYSDSGKSAVCAKRIKRHVCGGGMMPKPLIVHATVALLPSQGGIPVAVRDFHRAQEAKFVAFSNPAKLAAEGSLVPGAIHVPLGHNPARGFFPGRGRRRGVRPTNS